MKKSLDEHAERFSESAAEYDESQDSPEYRRAADLVVGHADPNPDETVLDLGTGTGAIAFGSRTRLDTSSGGISYCLLR